MFHDGASNISPSIVNAVKSIMSMGGNAKKIDTDAEYAALQELLTNSEGKASNGEIAYIQGFMFEYKDKVAARAEKEQAREVTPAARQAVKEIKAKYPDKKELNEAEARDLIALAQNTRGDFNSADIDYFRQEIIKAGFGSLLEDNVSGKNVSEGPVNEFPVADDNPAEPISGKVEDRDEGQDVLPDGKSEEPGPTTKEPKDTTSSTPPSSTGNELTTEEPHEPHDDNPIKMIGGGSNIDKTAKKLTESEKKEAKSAGKAVGEELVKFTGTWQSEQERIRDYTTHRLNSRNIVEFMRGYREAANAVGYSPDPFFKQLMSESSFPDKGDIAKQTAIKLKGYLQNNPSSQSDNQIKIIDGILAQTNGFNDKNNQKQLDAIIESII